MKETPSKRITVTSSLNDISTDQLASMGWTDLKGKFVHVVFKNQSRSLLQKRVLGATPTPPPPLHRPISQLIRGYLFYSKTTYLLISSSVFSSCNERVSLHLEYLLHVTNLFIKIGILFKKDTIFITEIVARTSPSQHQIPISQLGFLGRSLYNYKPQLCGLNIA